MDIRARIRHEKKYFEFINVFLVVICACVLIEIMCFMIKRNEIKISNAYTLQ